MCASAGPATTGSTARTSKGPPFQSPATAPPLTGFLLPVTLRKDMCHCGSCGHVFFFFFSQIGHEVSKNLTERLELNPSECFCTPETQSILVHLGPCTEQGGCWDAGTCPTSLEQSMGPWQPSRNTAALSVGLRGSRLPRGAQEEPVAEEAGPGVAGRLTVSPGAGTAGAEG